ncbi:MAG: VOC family protein [Thiohalomonadales bacterium]
MTTNNENNPRQENCPWLMPILYVSDIQKSIDFYQSAFGFTSDMEMKDDDGSLSFAEIKYKGIMLFMILREGSEMATEGVVSPVSSRTAPPISLYVYCDDIEALTQQAKQNYARIVSAPEDAPWGDRTAVLKDPDDFTWCFATKIANFEGQQKTA